MNSQGNDLIGRQPVNPFSGTLMLYCVGLSAVPVNAARSDTNVRARRVVRAATSTDDLIGHPHLTKSCNISF